MKIYIIEIETNPDTNITGTDKIKDLRRIKELAFRNFLIIDLTVSSFSTLFGKVTPKSTFPFACVIIALPASDAVIKKRAVMISQIAEAK
jgi:hypothetical protein